MEEMVCFTYLLAVILADLVPVQVLVNLFSSSLLKMQRIQLNGRLRIDVSLSADRRCGRDFACPVFMGL